MAGYLLNIAWRASKLLPPISIALYLICHHTGVRLSFKYCGDTPCSSESSGQSVKLTLLLTHHAVKQYQITPQQSFLGLSETPEVCAAVRT